MDPVSTLSTVNTEVVQKSQVTENKNDPITQITKLSEIAKTTFENGYEIYHGITSKNTKEVVHGLIGVAGVIAAVTATFFFNRADIGETIGQFAGAGQQIVNVVA